MTSQKKLRKTLSWTHGTAMTIGAVLGTGVLVLPATAAIMAGPASLLAWVFMALLTLPLALTLGYMAIYYPNAGGVAAYARQALGPAAGTITGWLFLGTVPVGGPITALIGANYIGAILQFSDLTIYFIAAFILLLGLILNYRGIEIAGWAQMGVIIVIAAMLLAAAGAALPYVSKAAFQPFLPHGWKPVGQAMVVLFWAFVGWEMIAHLTEEFANPKRDIPKMTWLSIFIINALYLLVAFVTVGTNTYLGEGAIAPLSIMIQKGWGPNAAGITAILGFLVCFGTNHIYIAGFSRLLFAQAREGDFPAFLAALHPKYATPHVALITMGIVNMLVLGIAYLLKLEIAHLMQLICAIFIMIYLIAMASAIRLFHNKRILRLLASCSFLLCLLIYLFTGWSSLFPFAFIMMGTIFYYLKKRKQQTDTSC